MVNVKLRKIASIIEKWICTSNSIKIKKKHNIASVIEKYRYKQYKTT